MGFDQEMQDALRRARTPTDAAIRAAWNAVKVVGPNNPLERESWTEGVAAAEQHGYAALLSVEAPRILALAYREAARIANEHAQAARDLGKGEYGQGREHGAEVIATELEALATALEEGTPKLSTENKIIDLMEALKASLKRREARAQEYRVAQTCQTPEEI